VPAWAYARGGAIYYLLAFGLLGTIPLYFLGARASRLGAEFGFCTQAELLAKRFSSPMLSVIMAALTVLVLIPYLVIQMKGAGYVIETISMGRVPAWAGAGITYGIVMIYVLVSGVSGVGWTNALQGAFLISIVIFFGVYFPEKLYGGIPEMFDALVANGKGNMLTAPGLTASGEEWSWWSFSSWILVAVAGVSCWPHVFMKAFAAPNEQSFRLTIALYPIFHMLLFFLIFLGFSAILAYPDIAPADKLVPYLLTQAGLPSLIIGLLAVGVLSASMSSGDTILHAAASIFIRDGVQKACGSRLTEKQEYNSILASVVVVSGVAYYFAVFSDLSLITIFSAAYGGVAQVMPVLIAAFYWPRATASGAIAGLLGGIAVNIFFMLNPETKIVPVHEGIFGLLANVFLLVSVSYLSPPPHVDKRFLT